MKQYFTISLSRVMVSSVLDSTPPKKEIKNVGRSSENGN
jgi:hypothetical protein